MAARSTRPPMHARTSSAAGSGMFVCAPQPHDGGGGARARQHAFERPRAVRGFGGAAQGAAVRQGRAPRPWLRGGGAWPARGRARSPRRPRSALAATAPCAREPGQHRGQSAGPGPARRAPDPRRRRGARPGQRTMGETKSEGPRRSAGERLGGSGGAGGGARVPGRRCAACARSRGLLQQALGRRAGDGVGCPRALPLLVAAAAAAGALPLPLPPCAAPSTSPGLGSTPSARAAAMLRAAGRRPWQLGGRGAKGGMRGAGRPGWKGPRRGRRRSCRGRAAPAGRCAAAGPCSCTNVVASRGAHPRSPGPRRRGRDGMRLWPRCPQGAGAGVEEAQRRRPGQRHAGARQLAQRRGERGPEATAAPRTRGGGAGRARGGGCRQQRRRWPGCSPP